MGVMLAGRAGKCCTNGEPHGGRAGTESTSRVCRGPSIVCHRKLREAAPDSKAAGAEPPDAWQNQTWLLRRCFPRPLVLTSWAGNRDHDGSQHRTACRCCCCSGAAAAQVLASQTAGLLG